MPPCPLLEKSLITKGAPANHRLSFLRILSSGKVRVRALCEGDVIKGKICNSNW